MVPFIDPPAELFAQKSSLPNPADHVIRYSAVTWAKWFTTDDDLALIIGRHPLELSRGDVGRLATEALAGTGTWRGAFMAAMMWGYGTVGYGAYRTKLMLGTPNAESTIGRAANLVTTGQLGAAYESLKVRMCGSAFFTKFFYFVGLGAASSRPLPVVLDSVVANSLERLGVDVSHFVTATRGGDGRMTALGRDAAGYLRYVETMDAWAKAIHCHADQIEMWLFTQRPT